MSKNYSDIFSFLEYFCNNPLEILTPFPLLQKSDRERPTSMWQITSESSMKSINCYILCGLWSETRFALAKFCWHSFWIAYELQVLQFIEAKGLVKSVRVMAFFTVPLLLLSKNKTNIHILIIRIAAMCTYIPSTTRLHIPLTPLVYITIY